MIEQNKSKTLKIVSTVAIALLCVVIVFIGMVDYNKKAYKEERKEAVIAYNDYVDNSEYEGMFSKELYSAYDFYKDMEYEGKLLAFMQDWVEDDIDFKLDILLNSSYFYEEDVKGTEEIVYLPFISEANRKQFEHNKDVFRRYHIAVDGKPKEELDNVADSINKAISVGMSSNLVTDKLGEPKDKTTTVTSLGTSEMWLYDDKTVFFSNGEVEGIVY